ncbi:hypothetical protein NHX12_027462 [Muraenolepis orangiensis]|uniref:Uncharacterized protein n=1 Tax=Muraenolepis orangiensis TaxID=630683 RepID=A0A9Q0EDS9_9TELE|nr:hypothetical protein NHX12_027462 [Muraenolepis orangiensis]
MSIDEESTSCYSLLEAERCHLLLGSPGRYALVGQPLSQEAPQVVFGRPDASNPLGYNLRVCCVDDTPRALQTHVKTSLPQPAKAVKSLGPRSLAGSQRSPS